jgi:hypothetical protein
MGLLLSLAWYYFLARRAGIVWRLLAVLLGSGLFVLLFFAFSAFSSIDDQMWEQFERMRSESREWIWHWASSIGVSFMTGGLGFLIVRGKLRG